MIKKIVLMISVVAIFFLQACESSEISMVKEATVNYDPSLTWGKAFDTYQYISDPIWDMHETDRGQKIVTFKAKYDCSSFFGKNYSPKFRDDLAEIMSDKPLYLTANFTISNDEKSFQVTYLGLEYDGVSSKRLQDGIEYDLKSIFINDAVFFNYPRNAHDAIYSSFLKTLLKSIADRPIFVDSVILSDGKAYYAIYSLEDVRIGDVTTTNVKFQLTNIPKKSKYHMPFTDFILQYPEYKILFEETSQYTLQDLTKEVNAPDLLLKDDANNKIVVFFGNKNMNEPYSVQGGIHKTFPLELKQKVENIINEL